jgi:retron-type reverse transcriptase
MKLLRQLLSWLFGPRPTIGSINPAPDALIESQPEEPAPSIKKGGVDGLDASDYLPIGREEMLEATRGRNLIGNPWFGRRDLIPPADDPRTRLIDRGMVGAGLITPEQLVEIHTVGAEMDRLRPTEVSIAHQAAKAGEGAVQADREERARLKAQKKTESVAGKQRRAEAIEHRRQTDIVFLGRGVSGRLGQRTSRTEDLERLGLPVLSTPADVAAALNLSVPRLRWLAFHTEVATRTHYVQFTVPKKNGGERVLSAPHRNLARAQRWVFEQIVSRLPAEPPAQGFLRGRGILTNAQAHQGRKVVVNLDLEGFFPSIGFPRVRKVFERLGYSPAVATIFALLCTECPRRGMTLDGVCYQVATAPRGLPQGACTSPGLSNQVARRLDRRLGGLAAKLGLNYTRYADDLTFSGDDSLEGRVGYLLARVRHIAQDEGFRVNEAKTRVLRRHRAQTVTGLVVNDRPGVPRAEVRRIRAILHQARSDGLDRQNREGIPNFRAWLRGKIAFVAMARPELGAHLLAQLNDLEGRHPAGRAGD